MRRPSSHPRPKPTLNTCKGAASGVKKGTPLQIVKREAAKQFPTEMPLQMDVSVAVLCRRTADLGTGSWLLQTKCVLLISLNHHQGSEPRQMFIWPPSPPRPRPKPKTYTRKRRPLQVPPATTFQARIQTQNNMRHIAGNTLPPPN